MHSFHLVRVPARVGALALARPPRDVPGLRHAEVMATMTLGAPVVSPQRLQVHRLAVFARWEDEAALERFLATDRLGRTLGDGWHVRLEFLRRWGQVRRLGPLPEIAGRSDPAEPVVAVTVARMRIPEVPRFVHWGRPVERQVRDHPAATLALAAYLPPRTVSTFSVWRSAREMTGMVHGRDASADGRHGGEVGARHARAMRERERRDFHREFTTLRFRPLSEHGMWDGRWVLPG
ncbi:hypothetical protein AVL62_13610 [Serinicoccus chungangensis]|uniref:Spheroidene monooxygenase n=1 Tax=Serinicoccus chungangensis TaxID=767452 RepID=A0A0W8IBY9_9MICO|nr:hypothetical protein [Serinicoccus chungangensis]KUG57455.1 hypothetical protein AVL62_13610 [Serinicoccus chungangensis]